MASYRPISEEIAAPTTLETATTVGDVNRVRVVNTTTSNYVLTVLDANDNVIGSMTLVGKEVFTLNKRDSDKVYATNAGVRLTGITYPVL